VTFKRIQFRKMGSLCRKKEGKSILYDLFSILPLHIKNFFQCVSKIHEKIHPKNSENNFASIANNKKKGT